MLLIFSFEDTRGDKGDEHPKTGRSIVNYLGGNGSSHD